MEYKKDLILDKLLKKVMYVQKIKTISINIKISTNSLL